NCFSECPTLRVRAHVAPDNGGAYNLLMLIEQDGAVHLTRQTDTRNLFGEHHTVCQDTMYRCLCRTPPVARILFRPTGLWGGKSCVLNRCRGDNATSLVNNDCATSACAN